ncbi:hypothetical protein [Bartonella sp. MU70NMGDW]|uniref:hypothetical protein n=1 Tax=Bartonella sp. MU70NMGDW TaxID=3243561 RepID=UPI0035CF7BDD
MTRLSFMPRHDNVAFRLSRLHLQNQVVTDGIKNKNLKVLVMIHCPMALRMPKYL